MLVTVRHERVTRLRAVSPRELRRSANRADVRALTRRIVKDRAYGRLHATTPPARSPAPTTVSERRLILAARRGDATAQARVLSQYEPMMRLSLAACTCPAAIPTTSRRRRAWAWSTRCARGTPPAASRSATSPGCAPPAKPATPSTPPAPTSTTCSRRPPRSTSPTAATSASPPATCRAGYEAIAQRRRRVRTTARAAPTRRPRPLAKTLAREQLRALIARTRTLSPLERRALMLANNDRSHTRDRRHAAHPRPRRQQRAPARAPQAPRAVAA